MNQSNELNSGNEETSAIERRGLPDDAEEFGLLAVELEIISFFVRLARTVDVPRTWGEIYGLLFGVEAPLAFEDVASKLAISPGATSKALQMLRTMNAVRIVYIAGDRRDHFVAETEWRTVLEGFLRQRLESGMSGACERLETLKQVIDEMDHAQNQDHFRKRVSELHSWHRSTQRLLANLSSRSPLAAERVQP